MIYRYKIVKGQLIVTEIFTNEDRIALLDARRAWEKTREQSERSIFKPHQGVQNSPITEDRCRVLGCLLFLPGAVKSRLPHSRKAKSSR